MPPPPLAAALALALAAAPRATPLAAIAGALAVPGGRVEVLEVRTTPGDRCAPSAWEALRDVTASGMAPLRFGGRSPEGIPCEGFAWARVRVLAPAAVTTRPLAAGDRLEGAVTTSLQEVLPGRAAIVQPPPGAVAERALAAGAVLDDAAIHVGPHPGDPVVVEIRVGALRLTEPGRSVPCLRGRACALLPSGRRVEGRLVDGRVVVEAP